MTRTDPRAISLENRMKKVPYEGRTPRSSRAGKSRTALLEKRTAPLLLRDAGISWNCMEPVESTALNSDER